MNKNSEVHGLIFVMAIIGAAFFLIAAAVFAAIAFLALILTVICLFAWDEPVTLFGDTVEPEQARAFIGRGVIGAGLLCAFLLFCSVLFGFPIRNADAWLYAAIAGYSLGSVGVEYLKAQQEQDAAPVAILPPVIEHDPQPVRAAREEPFRFASWDDESERDARNHDHDDGDRCRSCAYNDESYRPMPGTSLR